jgi:hypothetical protein
VTGAALRADPSCGACGARFTAHCDEAGHLPPCCPGRCPGRSPLLLKPRHYPLAHRAAWWLLAVACAAAELPPAGPPVTGLWASAQGALFLGGPALCLAVTRWRRRPGWRP